MTVISRSQKLVLAALIVIVVLGVADFTWRSHSGGSAEVVFHKALQRNLTETGLTCTIDETTASQTLRQKINLDLASKSNLHADLSYTPKPTTTINVEEVDVPTGSFVRYLSVKTTDKNADGQTPDFSNLLNVWGKTSQANQKTTLFGRTVLGDCIVPLAHLSKSQSDGMSAELAKNNIFKTDFLKAKADKLNGKSVLVYNVTVQPRPYIEFMKLLATTQGLHDLDAVKVADYNIKTPEIMKFYIDSHSQRLLQISYTTKQRKIFFSDYGKVPKVVEPTSYISAADLQSRFNVK